MRVIVLYTIWVNERAQTTLTKYYLIECVQVQRRYPVRVCAVTVCLMWIRTLVYIDCQFGMGSSGSGSDLRVSVQCESSSFILVDGVVRECIDNTEPVRRRAGSSGGECAVPASIAQYAFCSHIVIGNSVPVSIKCFSLFIYRGRLHGDLKFADFPLIANISWTCVPQTYGSLTPFHSFPHGKTRFRIFFFICFSNNFFSFFCTTYLKCMVPIQLNLLQVGCYAENEVTHTNVKILFRYYLKGFLFNLKYSFYTYIRL